MAMNNITCLTPEPPERRNRRTRQLEELAWLHIMRNAHSERTPLTDENRANIEPIDLTQYLRRNA